MQYTKSLHFLYLPRNLYILKISLSKKFRYFVSKNIYPSVDKNIHSEFSRYLPSCEASLYIITES